MTCSIYHSNGTAFATAKSLTYSAKRMGEKFVSVSVKSATPVNFAIGDYINYRGETFYLNVLPTVKRVSSNGSTGNALTYDGVRFDSVISRLTDCTFLDVVPSDNMLHTAMPTFDFYAETVLALAERILANIHRIDAGWSIKIRKAGNSTDIYTVGGSGTHDKNSFDGKKDFVVKITNPINCWQALALVNSEFGLNFYIEGKTIYIGNYTVSVNSTDLKYGKDNGLLTLERTTDDSQQVITRLRAYGNTTNIPPRYYANKGVICYLPILASSVMEFDEKSSPNDGTWFDKDKKIFRTSEIMFFKSGLKFDKFVAFKTTAAVEELLTPSCFRLFEEVNGLAQFSTDKGVVYFKYDKATDRKIFVINEAGSSVLSGVSRLEATTSVSRDAWPELSETKKRNANIPNNMHVDRLMLPGFPTSSSDSFHVPYIDSANIAEIGVREATVYFDGSNDNADIYPTLVDKDGKSVVSIQSATGFEGNGVYGTDSTSETVPDFTITIHFDSPGNAFNVWACRIDGEKPTISMKTGACTGREFEIVKCKMVSSTTYELTCKRSEDSGLSLYFPYTSYPVRAGDQFVFLNIEMPDVYIDTAAKKLEAAAIAYLNSNCRIKYNYNLTVSSIYMQRLADAGNTLGADLAVGKLLSFYDLDIVDGTRLSIPIESLEIKDGEEILPKYTITLSEDTTVSTIARVQNNITAVEAKSITQVFPLTIRQMGEIVGVYNPAEKGLILDIGDVTASGEMGDCDASMCKITEDITAGKEVGYIKKDEKIPSGTSLQDIFKKLLIGGEIVPTYSAPTISIEIGTKYEYGSTIPSFKITGNKRDGGNFAEEGTYIIKDKNGKELYKGKFTFDASGEAVITLPDGSKFNVFGELTFEASIGYEKGENISAGTATDKKTVGVFSYIYYGAFGKEEDSVDSKVYTSSEISKLKGKMEFYRGMTVSLGEVSDSSGCSILIAYPDEFVKSVTFDKVMEGSRETTGTWNNEKNTQNILGKTVDGKISDIEYKVVGRRADSPFDKVTISIKIELK